MQCGFLVHVHRNQVYLDKKQQTRQYLSQRALLLYVLTVHAKIFEKNSSSSFSFNVFSGFQIPVEKFLA